MEIFISAGFTRTHAADIWGNTGEWTRAVLLKGDSLGVGHPIYKMMGSTIASVSLPSSMGIPHTCEILLHEKQLNGGCAYTFHPFTAFRLLWLWRKRTCINGNRANI